KSWRKMPEKLWPSAQPHRQLVKIQFYSDYQPAANGGLFLAWAFFVRFCPPDAGYGSRDRGNRSLYLPAPDSHGRIAAHSAKLTQLHLHCWPRGQTMRKQIG